MLAAHSARYMPNDRHISGSDCGDGMPFTIYYLMRLCYIYIYIERESYYYYII